MRNKRKIVFFFSSLHSNSLKYHILKRLLTFSWGSLLLLPAGFFNSLIIFYLLPTLLHPLNTQGTVLTQWSDTTELKGLQELPVKLPNHCTVSWECNKNSMGAVGIVSVATAKAEASPDNNQGTRGRRYTRCCKVNNTRQKRGGVNITSKLNHCIIFYNTT